MPHRRWEAIEGFKRAVNVEMMRRTVGSFFIKGLISKLQQAKQDRDDAVETREEEHFAQKESAQEAIVRKYLNVSTDRHFTPEGLELFPSSERASTWDKDPSKEAKHLLPCPRSALFVPCSNRKALDKIASIPADLFILDLEDSVAPSKKQESRELLTQFVQSGVIKEKNKRVIVRINSLRTDPNNALLDLEYLAALAADIEGIGIPKVAKEDYELMCDYLHPSHVLWAFFETPQSIIDAPAICATRKYQYAVMGLNDLSHEMGYPLGLSGPRVQHYFAMSSVVTAARANNLNVLDGVFNDPSDSLGFRAELEECRRFGFQGKTLIHPSQVMPCNELFTPTDHEVEWAKKVIVAVHEAGGGVAVVEGKMVEDLHSKQAVRVLQRHELGELNNPKPNAPDCEDGTRKGNCEHQGNSDPQPNLS